MTPKMATDKVNAPAVSRLAGEIARNLKQNALLVGALYPVEGVEQAAIPIISAALSEREEKVAKAASHLRVALSQVLPSDDQIIVGHMRDALKELEATWSTMTSTGRSLTR